MRDRSPTPSKNICTHTSARAQAADESNKLPDSLGVTQFSLTPVQHSVRASMSPEHIIELCCCCLSPAGWPCYPSWRCSWWSPSLPAAPPSRPRHAEMPLCCVPAPAGPFCIAATQHKGVKPPRSAGALCVRPGQPDHQASNAGRSTGRCQCNVLDVYKHFDVSLSSLSHFHTKSVISY